MNISQLSQNPGFKSGMMATALLVAFGAGVLVTQVPTGIRSGLGQTASSSFDSAYLQELYELLDQEYLGDIPTGQKLTQGMAKGLVDALGDEYSSLLTPEEAEQYLADNDSAFEGIGVQLGFDGQYSNITTVFEGYPGEGAGLRSQDIIIEVDGADVTGQRPELVATKIRGKAGTTVKLKVIREGASEVLTFDITRQAINLDNISHKDLGNGIVQIDVIKFTEGQDGNSNPVQVFNTQWDKVVDEVKKKNPRGLVLDLRNNPGGYVDSVKYVAEEFLKRGEVIMQEQSANGDTDIFRDYRDGDFESIPMVVLVNEGSASASEIFAGAMQDNGRAKVVGKQTVGKGVEQKVIPLEDNSLLMVVFKRWLTPKGQQLSKESPIKPDFDISSSSDNQNTDIDLQLNKALELLGD